MKIILLVNVLFIICFHVETVKSAQCSSIPTDFLGSTFYDTYSCCYQFGNGIEPIFKVPSGNLPDLTPLNLDFPISDLQGTPLPPYCVSQGFYYEKSQNFFQNTFIDEAGKVATISTFQVTSGNILNAAKTLDNQGNLRDILAGKRGILMMKCQTKTSSFSSCVRMRFNTTQDAFVPNVGILPVVAAEVQFNGNTTNCTSNDDTYYLTAARRITAIGIPVSSFTYNATTQNVDLAVNAWYIPSAVTYVIRFSPFDSKRHDINKPGSCENRNATTFVGKNFDQWWGHAGNALFPGALNNVSYPAYGPAKGWNIKALDCARIQYTRSFTLQELSGCTGPNGESEITVTDMSTNSGVIIYEGTLYITAVLGLFTGVGTGNKAGYSIVTWKYPFRFTFQTSASSTALVADGYNFFQANVLNTAVISSGPDTGKMSITISTKYYATDYGYIWKPELVSTTGSNLVLTGTPSDSIQISPATQTFTWISESVKSTYDGVYTFQWLGIDCTKPTARPSCNEGTNFTTDVVVYLSNTATQQNFVTFGSSVSLFDDTSFAKPHSAPFRQGFPVCFKNTLRTSLEDSAFFRITIKNAYLCIPNNITEGLKYDGITNFGCLNATKSTQLVLNGTTSTSAIGFYANFHYNPTIQTLSRSIDVGLCIKAQPQLIAKNGSLYDAPSQFLQVELNILRTTTSNFLGYAGPNTGEDVAEYLSLPESIRVGLVPIGSNMPNTTVGDLGTSASISDFVVLPTNQPVSTTTGTVTTGAQNSTTGTSTGSATTGITTNGSTTETQESGENSNNTSASNLKLTIALLSLVIWGFAIMKIVTYVDNSRRNRISYYL